MRILLVNWAHVWDGAGRGGGINGYCQAIALELVTRGHEVLSLCSGTTYERAAGSDEPGPCWIKRHDDWLGIRVCEVINSPVLAPSLAQFRDPDSEVSAPALEEQVRTLIAELQPDTVHIQSLEGFSTGCIAAIRAGAPNARIVFSLHNYHPLCPQVYLLQGHRRACVSFDNGHACDGCVPTVDPAAERRRLASGSRIPAQFQWADGRASSPHAPGSEERRPHPWSEEGLSIPARRPLLNVIAPRAHGSRPPNSYGRRRQAMIEALSSCDTVIAVSEFVRRMFESAGVQPDRLRTLHIGTALADQAVRRSEPVHPPGGASSARHLAFIGYDSWYKGLPMLVESLELLTPEFLSQIHLTILAFNEGVTQRDLRRLEPRLAGLIIRGRYQQNDLPWLLAGIDMGIVPSVWWDNGPQTALEFLACGIPVLGAELGGIPDFIHHEQNGLLFRGNDRWDLARTLASIVRDPSCVARLRAGVRPPKGVRRHAAELEDVYSGRVS